MRMINGFGRAFAALGLGIVAVGHWLWVSQSYHGLLRARFWDLNGALKLYVGIFLIGVGVHALASCCWFDDPDPQVAAREPQ